MEDLSDIQDMEVAVYDHGQGDFPGAMTHESLMHTVRLLGVHFEGRSLTHVVQAAGQVRVLDEVDVVVMEATRLSVGDEIDEQDAGLMGKHVIALCLKGHEGDVRAILESGLTPKQAERREELELDVLPYKEQGEIHDLLVGALRKIQNAKKTQA